MILSHSFHRTNNHMGIPAFQPRLRFHRAMSLQILSKPHKQLFTQIDVSNLASAELHHRLHTISLTKKANRVVLLKLVIVVVGVGTEFQFLHLDHVLLPFRFVLLFLVLVLPLAIIHRLGDRRLGRGCNQDQIQSQFLRPANRGLGRHNLDGTIRKHSADFPNTDRFIYIFSDSWTAGREISGGDHCHGAKPQIKIGMIQRTRFLTRENSRKPSAPATV